MSAQTPTESMSSSSADADAAAVGEASTVTGRHLMNCIDKHIVKTNTQSQTQPFNGSSVTTGRHVPPNPVWLGRGNCRYPRRKMGIRWGSQDHLGQTL